VAAVTGVLIAPLVVLAMSDSSVPSAARSTHPTTASQEKPTKQTITSEPANTADTVRLETHSESSSDTKASKDAQNQATTKVRINGQNIPVPQNGSIHKTIKGNNNRTSVDIDIDGTSSSSSTHESNVRIDSNSETSVDIDTERSVHRQ